jgi:O-antigen/teichoic acid export membrane protein
MKRHASNLLAQLSATGLFLVCQWLILCVISHTTGPHDLGYFTLAISITTPAAVLFTLAARTHYLADVGPTTTPFQEHFSLRLVTTATYIGTIAVTAFSITDDLTLILLIAATGLARAADNISDILYARVTKDGDFRTVAVSTALRSIPALILFTAVFLQTHNLPLATTLATLPPLATLAFYDIPHAKRSSANFKTNFNMQPLWHLFQRLLPLGISVFLSGLSLVIPRFVLEHTHGLEDLGTFAALAYTVTLGNLLIGAAANVLLTEFSHHWQQQHFNRFFRTLTGLTAAVLAAGIAGTILAYTTSDLILPLVYGNHFLGLASLFTAISAATVLIMIGNLWTYALIGTRNNTSQLTVVASDLAVTTTASLLLIPVYGIWGAAAAYALLGLSKCLTSATAFALAHKRQKKAVP